MEAPESATTRSALASDGSPDSLVVAAERLAELTAAREQHLARRLPDEAGRRIRQLRDHLSGHILPRARSLDAPLLVLLLGPTGAGKSSLLNTLSRVRASPAGVMRPTTREMVVAARPEAHAGLMAAGGALVSLAGERLDFVASDSVPDGVALV